MNSSLLVLTTERNPLVGPDVETHLLEPGSRFWDFPDCRVLTPTAPSPYRLRLLRGRPIQFIYQRYSRNNFTGLAISGERGVPLILEYNGSEVWLNRNWGRPLKYEALTERIESAISRGAISSLSSASR